VINPQAQAFQSFLIQSNQLSSSSLSKLLDPRGAGVGLALLHFLPLLQRQGLVFGILVHQIARPDN